MDPAGYVPPPAHQQLEPIHPRLRDLDGVLQPLPGLEVVDHIRAVGVADDIDVYSGTVLAALIPRRQVVVGNAFATLVEVFRFDLSRHCGGAAELRDEGIPGTVTPCLQGPRSRREVG